MRSENARDDLGGKRPWRLLLASVLVSLLCGLVGFHEIAEDALRVARNRLHPDQASGQVVMVGIDDQSIAKVGSWPWPRSTQARLIDRLTEAGAKSIVLDLVYGTPTNAKDDRALAEAIQRSGRVSLAVGTHYSDDVTKNVRDPSRPLDLFTARAKLVGASAFYNYQQAVWLLNYQATAYDGTIIPTAAAHIAGKQGSGSFRVDYSINPASIPYLSAADMLTSDLQGLAGKTVVVGLTADQLGSPNWIPGTGRMGGSYKHIIGAETLIAGDQADLGWLPLLAVTFLLTVLALNRPTPLQRSLPLGALGIAMLAGPLPLEHNHIFIDVVPTMLFLTIVGGRLTYLKFQRGALVNAETGLPNLAALKVLSGASSRALVVARVQNQAAIASILGDKEEIACIQQVIARLGAGDKKIIYQGDEGVFAWLAEAKSPIADHLEALHALFMLPLAVGDRQLDIAISFGVELGSNRPVGTRLGSALVAADEAWAEGLKWKLHDPARQEEVSWRMSLLGELDTAIDNGEVWLAYQPQLCLQTGRLSGAEVLARWTHPTKGPISPTEFIAAAETSGRILKLTEFVLDQAISAAAKINARGVQFQIAVNLSARLLTDRNLANRVERLLETHKLAPQRLTLELTETASLQDAASGLAALDALARLGVRIAIDDYGTGLSTLDYLKKIPATEIKIDQSFVKAMRFNRSDLIMVQSTIALAHSLERTVVAEGVEDQQCLEELTRMGCDVAQGFAIGRPVGIRDLVQRLQLRKASRVA